MLRLGLDRQNSYTSGYLNRENQISVFFRKTINDIHNIEISGNLKKLDERNNYNSYVLDTVMYRNQWILTPNATYEYKPKKKVHWRNSYRIQYQMLVDAPLMSLMVPVRNTYNPLAIMTGNSYLKNTTNNFILISINNEGRGWRSEERRVGKECRL